MKRIAALVLMLAGVGMSLALAQAPPRPDPWAKLGFLVGEWKGLGTGAPGEGVGGSIFTFELDRNILIRKNWAKYPPKPGETAGITHEDLMTIYPEPGGPGFKAIYFDNEVHVIRYAASFPGPAGAVVFESEAGAPGPRFRLSYALGADGRLTVVFSMAMPGADFQEYARGTLVLIS